MSNNKWTQAQRDAASKRMTERNAGKKKADAKTRIREPLAGRRDVTAVHDIDTNEYVAHWVNDKDSRLQGVLKAGYEHVRTAKVGDSNVDGTHNQDGVVSRDMGKGIIAYLMKQRRDYYDEDQATKQREVDETEESIRRDKNDNRNDGHYGEIKIG